MKIPIRQGIIRARTNLTGPAFLEKSLVGNSVHLRVTQAPIIDALRIAFAHYDSDYLFEETSTVLNAWGSGVAPMGGQNGPLAPGKNHYLYWDIDSSSADRTFGWVTQSPVVSAFPPVNPTVGLHWFDLSETVMKVWENERWTPKIRLFAGIYDSAGNVSPFPIGESQVGLTGSFFAGAILFSTGNRPLRQREGNRYTFVTTESLLTVGFTSGQNVKFDSAVIFSRALEPLEKFSLVSFKPSSAISKASSNNLTSFVSGIIVEDLHENEVGQVIANGVITNQAWLSQPLDGDIGRPLPPGQSDPNFWLIGNHINSPIFCTATGQLTLIAPIAGVVQQVGVVSEKDSVLMNIFPPVRIR